MDLLQAIHDFASGVSHGSVEIYNEASVQYELAMFLRRILPAEYKVQLERNIEYFGLDRQLFLKKEMDIVVFHKEYKERHCIEIKFPVNGQHPEQMFKICEDIRFLEQLTEAGFRESYSLVLTADHLFYSDGGDEGIYKLFRKNKQVSGMIQKPTGKKDKTVVLNGSYRLEWKTVRGDLKYFLVQVIA